MVEEITSQEKKTFLKWLTQHHKFTVRETLWILDYLYNHETMLKKSHFVEKVDQTPRGLYLSVTETNQPPFIFYKNGQAYDDPIQAFHDLRLNWASELYLEIDFKDAWQSKEYLAVLEDNPYAPWNDDVSETMVAEMAEILESFTLRQARIRISHEINNALSEENREKFQKLSDQLEEIDQLIDDLSAKD